MWAELIALDWLTIFRDLVDFAILATLIYWGLYFLRGTKSANVLFGIICLFCVAALLSKVLELKILGYLLDHTWAVLGMAIIVIFQPELRRAFAEAGSLFTHNNPGSREMIDEVVQAAFQLSETKTGALIVFEQNIGLAGIVNTAVSLDCKVNALLLHTIFFKNSPLHDCAVIIRKNRIAAAHAVLPLTQEGTQNPVKRLGTRHRAAVGITEETDAVALVVSEETGKISLAHKGRIVRDFTEEELKSQLNMLLLPDDNSYRKVLATLKPAPKQTGPVQADLFESANQEDKKK